MDHAHGEAVSANGSDLDPDVRRFIRRHRRGSVARHPGFDSAPVPQLRRWTAEARAPWRQGGPAMLETQELAVPTRHGPVRVRIHRPGAGILPGLVYLHGGGWTLFSIDTHDRVMREYAARAGCCVIGVDYALSPEQKFPVPLEQVVDVVDWLAERGHELGSTRRGSRSAATPRAPTSSVAACLVRRDRASAPPLRAMLLNYGAFVSRSLPRTPAAAMAARNTCWAARRWSQYWRNYMRSDADAEDPLVCPLLGIARRPAARIPRDRRMRHPRGAEHRDGATAAGMQRARARASSIPARRTASSRPCRLPQSATRPWRTLSAWLKQVLLQPGPGPVALRLWPDRDGMRPCRECAGCGGD